MQPDTLPQQHSDFDVKMSWDMKIINGKSVIDGIVKNIRYAMMENIEIWVALLDSRGNTVERAVDLVMPMRLDLGEAASFRVVFQQVVPHGARLVFSYKYDGSDGGDCINWRQSFEACAP